MTTDITELAQSLKAAAVRAKTATEEYVAHRMSITVCLEECKEFNDLSDGPDNILALLEVLEKAQQRITQLESRTVKLPEPEQWDITQVLLCKKKVVAAIRAAGIKVEQLS